MTILGGRSAATDQAGQAVPRPPIPRNDYTVLDVPALGEWTPSLAVSVVIPAHGHQEKLDLVLAALAAQSYPAHLMEVVVVDDGSAPPLRLPEIRPEHTRLITAAPGAWGSGHALNCGVAASEGAVVLRLDADMLVFREHVESQLRWHHQADYLAVLGHKMFVPFTPGAVRPAEVRRAVAAGEADRLFDAASAEPHWIESVIARTDRLTAPDPLAYRVFIGATGSLHRAVFEAAGGMAGDMVLGGDSEFAYRVAQTGAVFVPDTDTSSWHLGRSQMQAKRDAGTRFRHPYVATRVPNFANRRKQGPRQWAVPYVDVVVDVAEAALEDADTTVAALLTGETADIRVWLVGPWPELTDDRRSPLEDPRLDLRLIRETFRGDARVRFADTAPAADPLVPFRLTLPAGCRPAPRGLARLTEAAEREHAGLVRVAAAGVPASGPGSIRLERTAAYARARHLGTPEDDLDGAVERLFGLHWVRGPGVLAEGAAEEPPEDWRVRLRQAEEEARAQRERADRLERRLVWLSRGLPARLARRLAR
ncbi:glycosyltransferase family 2 protein [Streptomonospora nanhaiensis]|uniref:Glycosyltransferase involved in cell wall biosynthesis n=1 Tax=Streptomonospora nanhaiensis TaxID=1323731 RepID=A0A853BK63_9ACTN|nr:glycosyltransferase family A protein [Streptomonospora nanhaiensis]MBV2362318.1 glycosyltransferase [Streptomonospora nanhaiensis]MBX9388206.1 glycosyltransferase [Streptomonospora nanhaiensis]NYI95027.1 glycosyltransferase involved in cell wall biosynthesis [Streptomonospora nanhaiensis]